MSGLREPLRPRPETVTGDGPEAGGADTGVSAGSAGRGTGTWRPVLTAGLFWVVSFLAALYLGRFLPGWSQTTALFLSAATLIVFALAFVAAATRLSWHRSIYLAAGAIGLVLVILLAKPLVLRGRTINKAATIPGEVVFLTAAHAMMPAALGSDGTVQVRNAVYEGISDHLEEVDPEPPFGILALGLAQLLLAAGIGLWIGTGIDEKAHLIPIALVATLADIWSVSAGATAVIIRSEQIHYFLLRFPTLGGPKPAVPFLIGLTDFLFFGIFYQAALRFRLGEKKNLLLLAASFLIAVASALLAGIGLPVLPFMGLLFVIGNGRELQLKREDLKQMVLFLAGVLLAFLAATRIIPLLRMHAG